VSEFTDNSLRILNSLDDLREFRVTGIASFQQCPARWRAEQLGLVPGGQAVGGDPGNKWTRMGTAAHTVIERFIEDGHSDLNWALGLLTDAGMAKAEQSKVIDYLNTTCWPLHHKKIVTELRFTQTPGGGLYRISGALDLICYEEKDGVWEIWDHKTNRQMETAEEWQAKIQPMFYEWLLREELDLPADARVRYNIGYVLLGTVVSWDCDRDMPAQAKRLFRQTVDAFEVYKATGEWPERLNAYCYNCPLVKQCQTAQQSLRDLEALADVVQETQTALEYLEFLTNVKKLAEGLIEVERGALRMVMEEGGQTELQQGGFKAVLRRGSKRKAEFWPVFDTLFGAKGWDGTGNPSDALLEPDRSAFSEAFSVRLTGLDALAKKQDGLAERLVGVIEAVEDDEPTLTIRRVKSHTLGG
jgi:hypothetical protein